MSKKAKILIGAVIVVAVVGVCRFLIGLGMLGSSVLFMNSVSEPSIEYFITVNELLNRKEEFTERNIRLSGAVIGESIEFDEASRTLSFAIAHVPGDYDEIEQQGGLAMVLENAANDPNRQRIQVVYVGDKPDPLRGMAQAIVTGQLYADGIFYAEELLLKCPARYEEAVPDQAIG